MADYNLRYMGCHGPTNVLSFPIDEQIAGPEDEDVPVQLGSLVFSVDTLHRETLLYGQDPEEHCLRLLATGSGIWPATTTALKWMNCVPKCCLRQRLG